MSGSGLRSLCCLLWLLPQVHHPSFCGGDAEAWKAGRRSPICTTAHHHPESPDPAPFFSTGLPDYIRMGWFGAWSPDRLTSERVATSQLSWFTSSRKPLLSPSRVLGPLLRVRRKTFTKMPFIGELIGSWRGVTLIFAPSGVQVL